MSTRERVVLSILLIVTAFIVGLTTADWCWYGYCGP